MEKAVLLTSVKLICKLHKLQKTTDIKVLIIDDTVEIKRGKVIEGSCKNLWSNKEHRAINPDYAIGKFQSKQIYYKI